ncbi:hypothetical protein EBR21_10330 [bacterium]|nr:hypothetical protein [bacterium]
MRQKFQGSKKPERTTISIVGAIAFMCIALVQNTSLAAQDNQKTATNCPPLDNQKLKEMIEKSESKKVELVFFSSWCSDCGNHLNTLEGPRKILVGTFDKQPRIEKLVAKLKLPNRCFTDAGVAKKLKVTTVPTERTVTLETAERNSL